MSAHRNTNRSSTSERNSSSSAPIKGLRLPPPPLHEKLTTEGRWRTVRLLQSLQPVQDPVQLERYLFVQSGGDGALYESAAYRVCAAVHLKREHIAAWTPQQLVSADLSGSIPLASPKSNNTNMGSQLAINIPKTVECQIKCGRCKSTQVSVEQKQTRGADESMTVFVQCEKCGLRWKM